MTEFEVESMSEGSDIESDDSDLEVNLSILANLSFEIYFSLQNFSK